MKDIDLGAGIRRRHLNDQFERSLIDQMVLSKGAQHVPMELSLETLLELKKKIDRHTLLYVIETNYLPDNCMGILYVRKEDAAAIRERGKR